MLGRERIEYLGALVPSADSPPPFVETERRVDALGAELDGLRRGADEAFQSPPVEWVDERLTQLCELLQRTTGRSTLIMRADAPGHRKAVLRRQKLERYPGCPRQIRRCATARPGYDSCFSAAAGARAFTGAFV